MYILANVLKKRSLNFNPVVFVFVFVPYHFISHLRGSENSRRRNISVNRTAAEEILTCTQFIY